MKKGVLLFGFLFLITGCSFQSLVDNKSLEQVKEIDISQIEEINKETLAEEEFNDSGSAKAIIDETDLWNFYENDVSGLSIKYPHNVSFGENDDDLFTLRIESNLVDSLEGTMGYNEETALENIIALESGEYGEDVDFPLEVSKKVVDVDGINAQEFMVLGRFEVCDVILERKLYFFNNDYQIVVILFASANKIIESMPEYFELNKDNCGDSEIWNFDKQSDFYKTLENNQGSEITQEWFDTFDDIVNSIEIINTEVKINYFDSLQGDWVAVDDEKSLISFVDNKKIDYYDNGLLSEKSFAFYDQYPVAEEMEEDNFGKYFIVGSVEDSMEYKISKIDDENLELIYLPRGNTLEYIKK